MKKFTKVFLSLFLFSFIFMVAKVNGTSTSENKPMYWPVDVDLTTSKSTYASNEVVSWKVNIGGGQTTGPNFDVHFTDNRGHHYWIYNLNQYYTSFNLSYKDPGSVKATVTVYGPGSPAIDSSTITIQ